jgi:hypothetical protein
MFSGSEISMDDYEGALAQINPCKDLKGVETNLP